ncbi:MAG: GerMN domain-containing protein [Spirochaetaceae bacterium]
MGPANKAFIPILGVLAVAAAAGAYLLLGDKEPGEEEQREAAVQAAEEWIKNSSPTFVYDGTDLELQEVERKKGEDAETSVYDAVFQFDSRHAGYGDREGEILAQVITPHNIKIRVEKNSDTGRWEVSEAVTDGVFDEKAGEFLKEREEMTKEVDLFFMRVEDGQEEAVSVSRNIPVEGGVELSALEALLKGPLPEEEEKDYFSAIPEGVEIEDFEVQGGEAYVSFSAKIEKNVAGSAWVQGIRDQIGLTLRQFEHIERVEIAVEGQTEGILQP